MDSTPDGPRFVVGIRDEKEVNCYKDFFETEKLGEAKEKADEKAEKTNRSAIVFDRKLCDVVYRKVLEEKPAVEKVTPAHRVKNKKKDVEPQSDNDEYF